MKKYEERIRNSVPIRITINGFNQQVMEKANTSNASTDSTEKTEEDDYVWEPFWLTANEFLCIMQKEKENEASIYRMSLDGKNPKLLVKHARTPSASAP